MEDVSRSLNRVCFRFGAARHRLIVRFGGDLEEIRL